MEEETPQSPPNSLSLGPGLAVPNGDFMLPASSLVEAPLARESAPIEAPSDDRPFDPEETDSEYDDPSPLNRLDKAWWEKYHVWRRKMEANERLAKRRAERDATEEETRKRNRNALS